MSDDTDYRHTATAGSNKPTGKKDKSQATRLIELAAQAKLFHDQEGRGYATIFVAGHKETWPVKSKGFKDWMRQEFYACEKRGVNGPALQDAIETVEGQARFDAPEKSAHLRLAEHDGKIYVDLCDPSWRAIEITAHGWQVISEPPVKFVRAPGMIALPEPVRGDINRIFDYLNVAKQDCCLVLAWLMGAMRPTGPYPILILQGEQGTAKSTAAKVLRSLINPSTAPLRTPPR